MSEVVRCEKESEKLRGQIILKSLKLFWEQMSKMSCVILFWGTRQDRGGGGGGGWFCILCQYIHTAVVRSNNNQTT